MFDDRLEAMSKSMPKDSIGYDKLKKILEKQLAEKTAFTSPQIVHQGENRH